MRVDELIRFCFFFDGHEEVDVGRVRHKAHLSVIELVHALFNQALGVGKRNDDEIAVVMGEVEPKVRGTESLSESVGGYARPCVDGDLPGGQIGAVGIDTHQPTHHVCVVVAAGVAVKVAISACDGADGDVFIAVLASGPRALGMVGIAPRLGGVVAALQIGERVGVDQVAQLHVSLSLLVGLH